MNLGSSSGTTTTNTNLTDDIWFEIFLLLPLASIFKLRCVSKVWSSLLSNPNFINRWIKLCTSDKSLPWLVYHNINHVDIQMKFLISHPKSLSSRFTSGYEHGFSFKFLNPNSNPDEYNNMIYLVGSSNGLVLCTSSHFKPYDHELSRPRQYYVCNPLTHKWVSLPPTPTSTTTTEVDACFTCETTSSTSCYKVVVIPIFEGESNKFKIEVFSSDVGKWVVCKVSRPNPNDSTRCIYPSHSLVIVRGVLYWIERKDILAYNLNNKVETGGLRCRVMRFPDLESSGDSSGESNAYFLGEYEGLLCYTAILTSQKTLTVWVFKENWRLLHKEDLCNLIAEIFRRFYTSDEDPEGEESAIASHEQEEMVIKEIEILGFNPVDNNVILLRYKYVIWAYNIQTRGHEELAEPSFVAKTHSGYMLNNSYATRYRVHYPFSLKAMPTILPPLLGKHTSSGNTRVSNLGWIERLTRCIKG